MKRLGDVDALSREFAREHSGRLWKQLLLSGDDEPARASSGWLETLVFAVAAAVVDPGRTPRCRLPRRGADLAGAERQPVRVAVPRRVLRPPTAARHPALGADGGAVRPRCARGQPLPVGRGLGHRGPRRARISPVVALVRRRLPVHGRHGPVARAAHGLRPLHGRMVHLLRADRARGWRAHGLDRRDPRAHGGRRRPDRRVGAALGSGGCRDRGRMARRVEATGRREHGAGAHDALHAAVRGDAGRRRRRLRRDRARRRVRSRAPQRLRRPAGGRPRARPVRDVRAGPVHVAGLDGRHPVGRRRQRPRARPDGARRDDRADRRPRVHPEPNGSARPQPRPPREPGRGRLALRPLPHRTQHAPPARALADDLPSRLRPVGRHGRGHPPAVFGFD